MPVTRYAIRFKDGAGWYCQGLPKEPVFEFAILYASLDHVKAAIKKKPNYFARVPYEIVPVTCTIGEPQK